MKLLFLDCETSGVNPNNDQIIELSGVIFDFDNINYGLEYNCKFSTLLRLRGILDSRITRLTGIEESELVDAPTLFQAQELWQEWLTKVSEEGQIKGIIGHSIDFDLGFLKKEKWYLPDAKIIDTLDLSRIMLPDKSAINLEFLSKNLELEAKIPKELIHNISYHRSLFDTLVDAELFRFLINRLNAIEDGFLFDMINHNFVNLGIESYRSQELQVLEGTNFDNNIQKNIFENNSKLNFLGDIVPPKITINDIVPSLTTLQTLKNIINEQNGTKLNLELTTLTLQIYYCLTLDITKHITKLFLKLHSLGDSKTQYILQNLILELVYTSQFLVSKQTKDSELSPNSQNTQQINPNLPAIENILDQITDLVDTKINLGSFVNKLEVLVKINSNSSLTTTKIQKLINEYDFLLPSMNALMKGKYELIYTPSTFSGADLNAFKKLFKFIESLASFDFAEVSSNSGLWQNSQDNLQSLNNNLIEQIQLDQKTLQFNSFDTFKINLFGHNLTITKTNLNFNLRNRWQELANKKPPLEFTSQFASSKLDELTTLIDLPRDINVTQTKIAQNIEHSHLAINNLINLQAGSISNNPDQIIIILTSTNSTMASIDKYFNNDGAMSLSKDNFLILGESGSLTKIISKISTGFTGIVVVKYSQISKFQNLINQDKFAQKTTILLAQPPLFIAHDYWRNQFKEYEDYKVISSSITKIYQEFKISSLQQSFENVKVVVNEEPR